MKVNTNFSHQLILYVMGLFILAIGSNLFINANLGVSPSCTLALTLSYLFPFGSYAIFNFITNGILLILEAALIRKLSKTQAVQLALIFLYSIFIQMVSPLLEVIKPDTLFLQLLTVLLACFIMAIGSSLTIASNFTVLPMEGFVGVIAAMKRKEFGAIRIKVEVIMTLGVAIFSLLTLHNLSSIGIGTILAAYFTGRITIWFTSTFRHQLDLFIGHTKAPLKAI
ncbi:YczE/YyaS/YitT family protein [Amedibacillus sp. YH-ame6]